MGEQKRELWPLTGALFVVLVVIAFIPLGGNTPSGDDSAQKVVSFYSDNSTREIIATLVLALGSVSLIFYSALLKDRIETVLPDSSTLPIVALAGGVVTAAGFLAAAGVHFALADYADDIQPTAAQSLNALDSDFFLPFTTGLAVLVLASSLVVLRTKRLMPVWLGWVGIVIFIAFFTPAGFVAFGLSGIWIIIQSIRLYLGVEPGAPAPAASSPPTPG